MSSCQIRFVVVRLMFGLIAFVRSLTPTNLGRPQPGVAPVIWPGLLRRDLYQPLALIRRFARDLPPTTPGFRRRGGPHDEGAGQHLGSNRRLGPLVELLWSTWLRPVLGSSRPIPSKLRVTDAETSLWAGDPVGVGELSSERRAHHTARGICRSDRNCSRPARIVTPATKGRTPCDCGSVRARRSEAGPCSPV
jgi:hypothetical protein